MPALSWGEASPPCATNQQVVIKSVEISGNAKTKTSVIERELGFNLNEKVCESQIQERINRIKRMGLFSVVEHNITKQNQTNAADLKITVNEKWTTIPIVKTNSGGGVSQYILGVYDPNLFGEFLEAGAQYENLGGASSGVVWFKNPRLFDQRQGIDLQYWNTKRIRIKYDQDKNDPEVLKGFLNERERLYTDYFREISSDIVARFALDYNKDNFSTKILPDIVIEKNGPNPSLPPATELLITKVGLEFGKIDGEPQALDGYLAGVNLGYASSLKANNDAFFQADLSLHYYKPLSTHWQFAQRLLLGATTTKLLQYWYYSGGLDRIRGFADNRFAGSHSLVSNTEARYLLLEKPSVLVQGLGFVDAAAIGDEASALTKLRAASMGMGLRFILPQFYRFVLRLDYAKP
ncbi:MAG: BamA/TamA family outer membrane protein, partial [Bdellovibrionota bacterium]